MILRLAWEVEERGSNLLVTDGLLVLECATLSFKHDEDQSILRAYDLEGRLRWDVARKNVDHARVAPNVLGGRVVAAIVNADRSAHVIDVETSGVISIEREDMSARTAYIEELLCQTASYSDGDDDNSDDPGGIAAVQSGILPAVQAGCSDAIGGKVLELGDATHGRYTSGT